MCPQIFWNSGRRFFDLAPRAGAVLSQPIVGRGGACGDLDGDGDLDLVIVAHGHTPLVLRNECERRGKPLTVVVRGSVPNPFAYGARVTVEAQGRRQAQQVGAQVAYLSSGPAALTFGLGNAPQADRVTVRFLSGKVVERRNVRAGSRLVVKEVPARNLGPALDKARDALDLGDKEAARRALRAILDLDPLHPTALYLLATLEPPVKALKLCDRLLAVEPRVPRGYLLKARLLSDTHHKELMDLDAALDATASARRLNRVETGGAFEAGRILLYQGQVAQAAGILQKVAANPRAAALAALCRFRLGDPEGAQALLAPAKVRKNPVARLLKSQIGRDPRWRLVRLPVGPTDTVACDIVDADQDGHLDVRVGGRLVLMQGLSVRKVAGAPLSAAKSAPRFRPYSFAKAAAWALDPPRTCAGPPPGTTATAEADVDGDGRVDLIAACGGDDPAAPLPWWVLLRRAGGYVPLRGGLPHPGFRVAAVAAADLDGDGRAEIVLKGGGFLPGDTGGTWIATLRGDE